MKRDEELEAFKRINLSAYTASHGYALDHKSSSRNSAVMKDAGGDKIVIAKGSDQHWVYFSVHDESDHGSIIDFVQSRGGGNLGEVRKELRPWLHETGPSENLPAPDLFAADLLPITKDLGQVRARFEACAVAQLHPYLEHERLIPASVLASDRFEARIHIDERGNAIFPHYNREGVCGFEIKNKGFTGFAPGGEKGLWCSRGRAGDSALVIAETAIDALSYAALHGRPGSRYISTGGELNPAQPGLIKSAMEKMPKDSEVIVAVDNDEGGGALLEKIRGLFSDLSRAELDLIDARPSASGQDWNDALRASMEKRDWAPEPIA